MSKKTTETLVLMPIPPTFERATHFVRHVLDGATDAQLHTVHMTPRERDKLLENTVTLCLHDDDFQVARFCEENSFRKKTSYIYHRPIDDPHDILDTAAHEQFHAAKFWGTPMPKRAITCYRGYIGLKGEVLMGNILNNGLYALLGLPKKMLQEERGAFQFGYSFNPSLYDTEELIYNETAAASDERNARAFKAIGYPSLKEQYTLFNEAKKMCTQETGLFPGGVSELWKSYDTAQHSFSNAHHIYHEHLKA